MDDKQSKRRKSLKNLLMRRRPGTENIPEKVNMGDTVKLSVRSQFYEDILKNKPMELSKDPGNSGKVSNLTRVPLAVTLKVDGERCLIVHSPNNKNRLLVYTAKQDNWELDSEYYYEGRAYFVMDAEIVKKKIISDIYVFDIYFFKFKNGGDYYDIRRRQLSKRYTMYKAIIEKESKIVKDGESPEYNLIAKPHYFPSPSRLNKGAFAFTRRGIIKTHRPHITIAEMQADPVSNGNLFSSGELAEYVYMYKDFLFVKMPRDITKKDKQIVEDNIQNISNDIIRKCSSLGVATKRIIPLLRHNYRMDHDIAKEISRLNNDSDNFNELFNKLNKKVLSKEEINVLSGYVDILIIIHSSSSSQNILRKIIFIISELIKLINKSGAHFKYPKKLVVDLMKTYKKYILKDTVMPGDDGIIFTPTSSIQFEEKRQPAARATQAAPQATLGNQYKFKPRSNSTLDVLLKANSTDRNRLEMYVQGKNNTNRKLSDVISDFQEPYSKIFKSYGSAKDMCSIRANGNNIKEGHIIEVLFNINKEGSRFSYVKYRSDKTKPNGMRATMAVLYGIATPVRLEDLGKYGLTYETELALTGKAKLEEKSYVQFMSALRAESSTYPLMEHARTIEARFTNRDGIICSITPNGGTIYIFEFVTALANDLVEHLAENPDIKKDVLNSRLVPDVSAAWSAARCRPRPRAERAACTVNEGWKKDIYKDFIHEVIDSQKMRDPLLSLVNLKIMKNKCNLLFGFRHRVVHLQSQYELLKNKLTELRSKLGSRFAVDEIVVHEDSNGKVVRAKVTKVNHSHHPPSYEIIC